MCLETIDLPISIVFLLLLLPKLDSHKYKYSEIKSLEKT